VLQPYSWLDKGYNPSVFEAQGGFFHNTSKAEYNQREIYLTSSELLWLARFAVDYVCLIYLATQQNSLILIL
jgi:hypothetical protein